MGRIKELQEKSNLTEAEQNELNELLQEAKSVDVEVEKSEVDSEDKAIDEAAKKLADKAVADAEDRISKSIDKLTAKLDKGFLEVADDAKIDVNSPKFIVDKKIR